ncbi:MAG: hypothetical protein U5J78_01035 [Parasphingorhabdus sp.]|nr:hypothetical protein [Parasphingorhabdus sp.]
MNDDRLILAIGRIERALSRIEKATASSDADAGLAARHDILKTELRLAIEQIDQVIASEEQTHG